MGRAVCSSIRSLAFCNTRSQLWWVLYTLDHQVSLIQISTIYRSDDANFGKTSCLKLSGFSHHSLLPLFCVSSYPFFDIRTTQFQLFSPLTVVILRHLHHRLQCWFYVLIALPVRKVWVIACWRCSSIPANTKHFPNQLEEFRKLWFFWSICSVASGSDKSCVIGRDFFERVAVT